MEKGSALISATATVKSVQNYVKLSNDEIIKVFWSGKQVKHELGINDSDISKCCNRKLKSAGGYHWKYLYDNQLKNGEIIPGAITLGLITEEDALNQLKENKMINEKE